MPRMLILMRHAKSSWKDADLSDHDRPLTKRGKADAQRMGQELRQRDLLPDLIVSSSAKRARSTARQVARALGFEDAIVKTPDLYAVGAEEMLTYASNLSPESKRVLLIGHNPGMEDFCRALCGRLLAFPTAGVAVISWPELNWSDLPEASVGQLVWQFTPRELD